MSARRDGFASVMTHLVDVEQRLRTRGLTGRDALMAWMNDWQAGRVPASVMAADPDWIDVPGLAYQHFLPHRFKAKLGQFFTPRPIARLLVHWTRIDRQETVLDPFAGSGGLLSLCAPAKDQLRGFELDPDLAGFANQHLGAPVVSCVDAFTQEAVADVVVANPPFSLVVRDRSVLDRFAMDGSSATSEHVFALALHQWVKPNGRAAIVLPHSVLTSRSHQRVRAVLTEHFAVQRVCELPEGVFRPFGGAQGRAVVLWLTRQGGQPAVWAQLRDPGYDVTRNRPHATAPDALRALYEPGAWRVLPSGCLRPPAAPRSGQTVGELAERVDERIRASKSDGQPVDVLDLADVDKHTGQARPQTRPSGTLRGVRRGMRAGDVCVSRLRPQQGLVTVVPPGSHPVVGSSEWVVLRVARPHLLFHLLRTPTWRRGLPEPAGQTRPRVTATDVLQSPLATPSDTVSEVVEQLSRRLHTTRRAVDEQLARLQRCIDAYAEGRLDEEELLARITALTRAEAERPR